MGNEIAYAFNPDEHLRRKKKQWLSLKYGYFRKYLYEGWISGDLMSASYRFVFPNGYGASVIMKPGSYGFEQKKWELAVLNCKNGVGSTYIDYNTPITKDVLGSLSDAQVREILKRIKELE